MMYEDEKIRRIIQFLQGDIPLESRPFQKLAVDLEISEEEVLERIQDLQKQGVVRRWGAVLRHQQAGYTCNAMVAWKVGPIEADRAGEAMAEFHEVSHCYLREVSADFGYNLFSMVHARSQTDLAETISRIADVTGLDDYVVLNSIRELKKVSMRFFD
ncbi:MAG TPA: Lrp/AsnC family transcriptional regulator [Syntrophomonas sp.]|nr:Lrp/AsnC family transcriptional regulator [Syntrophomonas sp.]HRW11559.1 Lrp/AsnC family transcriptional regulator [Syntrophomonas sp.]